MILFGLFNLKLLFVCQICHVNCKTENRKMKINKIYVKTKQPSFLLNWSSSLYKWAPPLTTKFIWLNGLF